MTEVSTGQDRFYEPVNVGFEMEVPGKYKFKVLDISKKDENGFSKVKVNVTLDPGLTGDDLINLALHLDNVQRAPERAVQEELIQRMSNEQRVEYNKRSEEEIARYWNH